MEMYNHCVLCNPEVNWLEVEFRSENDEPINNLIVTITNPSTLQTHTMTAYQGYCVFGHIAAGEWVISVETENLLTTVEQYKSRKEGEPSPVKARAEKELGAAHKNDKKYHLVSVGDLWETPPEDTFLTEHHSAIMSNVRAELNGVRGWHNATVVLEIKALRSYMPMIVDTDEFNLINSYTFALLSKLAYATDKLSVDDGESTNTNGAIDTVTTQLRERKTPAYCSNLAAKWVVKEIPYSQALKYSYYADDTVGAEGYILFNDDIAIIGVRGSEPYFEDRNSTKDTQLLKIVKAASGIQALVVDKLGNIIQSPGMQDFVKTNLDAAQIAPPEFGGAYVHRGFYQYAMALWEKIQLNVNDFENKRIHICGHSLGGAGALILSSLINDKVNFEKLRLYTYGMPRTGTRSFVQRYQDILHYRHVNNHDLVPQVPMIWVNTSATEKFELSDIFSSGVTLAKKMISDNDGDNYLHHGQLSQLITYAKPNQVLLSPRQTQITMLDIAKMAKNDSVALVDGLTDASIADHGMEFYIPNLLAQLQNLSKESLYNHYQGIIAYLADTINDQQRGYLKTKNSLAEALGNPYSPVNQAYITRLKQELSISEAQLDNQHQVKQELTSIMNNPERLPLSLLLLSNQSLSEEIKEQLK
ncbi:lipase [Vibrio sp. YMD68]|uniref:lipase family protein n=1 Tax=Vibrio sp. YMD68 TaxID=3042300 RepID=UPI00249B47E4|nr:lipase [Vibrio sp. YMD68]WGW01940.1 lipase [Vibrio sp. YMD68]